MYMFSLCSCYATQPKACSSHRPDYGTWTFWCEHDGAHRRPRKKNQRSKRFKGAAILLNCHLIILPCWRRKSSAWSLEPTAAVAMNSQSYCVYLHPAFGPPKAANLSQRTPIIIAIIQSLKSINFNFQQEICNAQNEDE